MNRSSCDECRAIYREFQQAFEVAKDQLSGQNMTPEDVTAWVQQLNEDECACMRTNSGLWKTWRRMQEHRTLTGHYLTALKMPRNAISNPN